MDEGEKAARQVSKLYTHALSQTTLAIIRVDAQTEVVKERAKRREAKNAARRAKAKKRAPCDTAQKT